VNYEFPPIGGGASKVSFELARTLVNLNHEVIVLTSRFGDAPKIEMIDGFTVHRVWSWRNGVHDCGLRGAFTFLLSALPRLRKILHTQHIDVVHYFFGLPTGLLSAYSYFLKKKPYIISLRGSDVPMYDRDSDKLMLMHRLSKSISHRIWRNASQVFAVSHGLQELAVASFPDIDVDVIHNGVDFVDNSRAAQHPRADERILRLICVSRLIPRKGISDLFDAIALIPDIELELILIGTGPIIAALREHTVRLGIAEKVTMVGYCSRKQVEDFYTKADIFVLPTHSDAFANVILEAMSAALPVISCNVGGVEEAVDDGKTGILVSPRKPKELAAAITTLAHNEELRTKFGTAGQKKARANFTWNKNAVRHVAAYENARLLVTNSVERNSD